MSLLCAYCACGIILLVVLLCSSCVRLVFGLVFVLWHVRCDPCVIRAFFVCSSCGLIGVLMAPVLCSAWCSSCVLRVFLSVLVCSSCVLSVLFL